MIKVCRCDRPLMRHIQGEGPLAFYAETAGFLFWKRIRTGAALDDLPEDEAHAIVMHEIGHIRHWHVEKRLAWVLSGRALLNPEGFFAVCARQELEADDYAATQGYALPLAAFLARLPNKPQDGYPPVGERIVRLLK
jgi:hypothetical protein